MVRKLKNIELMRLSVDEFKHSEKTPVVIVLDNVRSALNIGSVFRTADAFAAEAVYLCGISAIPPNREISKTALGAEETVSWKYFHQTTEALEELKTQGYRVLVMEQTDESLALEKLELEKNKKYAILLGHEVDGVDSALLPLADQLIEIEQYGSKHSLNVAVSAGIALWQIAHKIR